MNKIFTVRIYKINLNPYLFIGIRQSMSLSVGSNFKQIINLFFYFTIWYVSL